MAKKADLLEQAKELKLAVTDKNTIAEIEAALKAAESKKTDDEVVTILEQKGICTSRCCSGTTDYWTGRNSSYVVWIK